MPYMMLLYTKLKIELLEMNKIFWWLYILLGIRQSVFLNYWVALICLPWKGKSLLIFSWQAHLKYVALHIIKYDFLKSFNLYRLIFAFSPLQNTISDELNSVIYLNPTKNDLWLLKNLSLGIIFWKSESNTLQLKVWFLKRTREPLFLASTYNISFIFNRFNTSLAVTNM